MFSASYQKVSHETKKTDLHPLNTPTMSKQTNAPTPTCEGIITPGKNSKLTWESGNANAVMVTAAYIAPDAPRDGRMSMAERGRFNKPLWGFGSVLAAADAVAEAAVDSWDINLGNMMRVIATCETRLANRPAAKI